VTLNNFSVTICCHYTLKG